MLFFEEIVNNPDLQVKIAGGKVGALNPPAIMMGDFALGSDVKWNSPIQELIKKHLGGMVQGAAKKIGLGAVAVDIANAIRDIQPLTWPAVASRKNWMMSNGPALKLPLLFVALKDGVDVTAPVKQLANAVFPSESSEFSTSIGGKNISALTAPNSYDMTGAQGCLSISIGSWFSAMNCYVLDSMTVNFPQQYLPSGKPLYAEVSLSLSPWQVLTYNDFCGFFK
jgi:hypothetical protein